MYYRGEGVEKDLAKAKFWFAKAAALNDPLGLFYIGLFNHMGYAGPVDIPAAIKAYTASTAQYDVSMQLFDRLDKDSLQGTSANNLGLILFFAVLHWIYIQFKYFPA